MGKTYQRRHSTTRLPLSPPDPEIALSDPLPPTAPVRTWAEWEQDCLHWRGVVLVGQYAHWCPDWNDLPMDETCPEWPCSCASGWQP
jgi:hypothetical protein